MKTPTASSATSSQREQTFLLSQVPRSPRSNGCSTPGLENPSASVHPKRFSTPSLTPKFLCAGKLNPRRNIWPDSRVFRIQWQPLLGARLGVRLNRIDRTFRLAYPAIDTFVGMNDQHVLTLVEAIHGADFHTIHQLAFDATLIDYVGHKTSLPDGQACLKSQGAPLIFL